MINPTSTFTYRKRFETVHEAHDFLTGITEPDTFIEGLYIKKDQTARPFRGELNSTKYVPTTKNGPGYNLKEKLNIFYYDLDAEGLRTIKVSSLHHFKVNGGYYYIARPTTTKIGVWE